MYAGPTKILSLILFALFISTPLAAIADIQQDTPCIECHQEAEIQTLSDKHDDVHRKAQVSCLDCHQGNRSKQGVEHYNYTLEIYPETAICQGCHKK